MIRTQGIAAVGAVMILAFFAGCGINVDRTYEEGMKLAQEQKFKEAAEKFELILKQTPTHLDSTINLAFITFQLGDKQRAIELYKKALEVTPEDPRLLQALAWVYINNNQPEEARAPLEKALTANPAYFRARMDLTNVYLTLKEYDKALESADAAIKLDPTVVELYTMKGFASLLLKQYEVSEKAFKTALDLAPERYGILIYLAKVYEEQGRIPEAIDSLRKYMELANPTGEEKDKLEQHIAELEKKKT